MRTSWGQAWVLAPTAAIVLARGGSSASSPSGPTPAPTPAAPPSILLILTDDLELSSMSEMPVALSEIAAPGVSFRNAFVPTSLCAASRATILTGRYAHNHELYTNAAPRGGYQKFRHGGAEESTIATWLRAAGYRTNFLGRYVNGYPAGDRTYVPPGWDDWHADFGVGDEGETALNYYDYAMNDNGVVTQYGREPEDYETDVLAARALEALRARRRRGHPALHGCVRWTIRPMVPPFARPALLRPSRASRRTRTTPDRRTPRG